MHRRFGGDRHGNPMLCGFCEGTGRCPGCATHIDGLAKVKMEIEAGYLTLAESTIQVHLQKVNEREAKERTFDKAVAVGGLALAGAALFSGLGLVAGAGALLMKENNFRHGEMFGGIERVFRIRKQLFRIGVFAVTSDNNLSKADFTFKAGINMYNNFNRKWDY